MPLAQDENAEGNNTVSVAAEAEGVSAMVGSVPPNAETATSQTVAGGGKNAHRESCRVAASMKNAGHVRDEPTLNQAMACFLKDRWLEATIDELTSLSECVCDTCCGCRVVRTRKTETCRK